MRRVWRALAAVACIGLAVRCGTPLTEEELFQKAHDARTRGQFQESAELFTEFVERFPESENGPNALFLLGFITANELDQPERAARWYNEFISRYPDHELAKSVQWELDNLGKSPDELMNFLRTESDSL